MLPHGDTTQNAAALLLTEVAVLLGVLIDLSNEGPKNLFVIPDKFVNLALSVQKEGKEKWQDIINQS